MPVSGDHSKITLDTKNVFIECTATDLTKAKIVLNMMVCAFSEYCAAPHTVEAVEVVTDAGTLTYPVRVCCCNARVMPLQNFDVRQEVVPVADINSRIGIDITAAEAARLLTRMQLPAKVAGLATQP